MAPTASQIAGTTAADQTIVNQAQRMRNANRASDNASTKENQAILRKYRRRGSSGICSMRDEITQWITRVAKLRNMGLTNQDLPRCKSGCLSLGRRHRGGRLGG